MGSEEIEMNSALFFLMSGAGSVASLVTGHVLWRLRDQCEDHKAIAALYCFGPFVLNLSAIIALILRKL